MNCQQAEIARNVLREAVFQSKVAKKTFSGRSDLNQDVNGICNGQGILLRGSAAVSKKVNGMCSQHFSGWLGVEDLSRQGL